MSAYKYPVALVACVLALTGASNRAAQYGIPRSTIDGGGSMRSTGGGFELSGTIGQPDAGTMSGGSFGLFGGFWHALLPMDCNEDGSVDLSDHDALTTCLAGPGAGVSAGCGCFDVDQNGAVDLMDFAVVQIGFTE